MMQVSPYTTDSRWRAFATLSIAVFISILDLFIVNIPFPNHPRALEAGEIDMAMTLEIFGAIAIDKGDANLVRHVFGDKSGKQEIGFIVNRRLMRDKPELVQRIVEAYREHAEETGTERRR